MRLLVFESANLVGTSIRHHYQTGDVYSVLISAKPTFGMQTHQLSQLPKRLYHLIVIHAP